MIPALALLVAAVARRTPAVDTARARLVALIADATPTPYSFAKVSGMAFDRAGRLYVTDFQDTKVIVFDGGGHHLGTVGRHGEGPGEFTAPTGPAVGPDGALYVRNLVFVERFVADPRTGILSRFDRALRGPALAPWASYRAVVVDSLRRYYFPMEVLESGTHRSLRWFARYGSDERPIDSLAIPAYPGDPSLTAFVQTGPHGGRMVHGIASAPFEPRTVWAVLPSGTVLSGDGHSPELRETDASGRTLRTTMVGGTGRMIPARERAESLAALDRRIDSLPVPVSSVQGASQAVRDRKLPETYPAYTALLVTGREFWVRRWAPAGKTFFDRYAISGTPLGTLVLPVECAEEPLPVVRENAFACLTLDAETGAEAVALLTIPSGAGRARP